MSNIVAGFVTSHATALLEPERWEGFRKLVRDTYEKRFGELPPEPAEVALESDVLNGERYAKVRALQDRIAENIATLKPDAIVLFGNDQDENFNAGAFPQFAIYTGSSIEVHDFLNHAELTYPAAQDLSEALLDGCVRRGFDVVRVGDFNGGKLKAHAHAQVMTRFVPSADIPVIPVFVNAVTPPLPSVRRCFDFGAAIGDVLRRELKGKRVVLGASGGLSHFTSGYPYQMLSQPRALGSICADFDIAMLESVRNGQLSKVAELGDQDLYDNGNIELRQGITFFGALSEGALPAELVYEPFYKGLMGFWAGYWEGHDL